MSTEQVVSKVKLAADLTESGRGLGLLSLFVGLLAGGAAYAINEYWLDRPTVSALSVTALQLIVTFAAGWLLLSERRDFLRPIPAAALIALALAWPTFHIAGFGVDDAHEWDLFPFYFWCLVAGPLAFYLMLALAKAALETGFKPQYTSVFFHGLTLPLVAGGAKLFAGLALVLLFAWAALLKQMDVKFFSELFDEPWFIMPFLGAIGGLSIAMIRGQQAVLGALRFILLLFSRIAMPIMAAFSITFLIVLALKGTGVIFDKPYPAGAMLGLAFAGMLIFNGVYQNGEGAPPPWWLRIATLIVIATFPVYSGLAAYAFRLRVEDYGLTPARIIGLSMTTLAFAYSLVCLAGLLSELNWKGKRWMPSVAPLNTLMAIVWVVVLIGVSSPIFNSWAISAASQERLLLSRKIDAEKFDFGFLKFRLGKYGEAALDRLDAASGHPQAATIRAGVARAQNALSYWEYQNPELVSSTTPTEATSEPQPPADAPATPGPLDLPFNPEGGAGDDAPASPDAATSATPN